MIQKFYPFFIYALIQCITPGPNNLTCLYLGGTYGLKGTSKFLIGSIATVTIKCFLCGALNLVLADLMPGIVNVLKWLGAAYMVYLAYIMAKSGWRDEQSFSAQQTESSIRSGVILQLLNGKTWIVCISMFAVYIIPVSAKLSAVFWCTLVFAVLCLVTSLIWTLFGNALRNFISQHRKPFAVIMALSLLYCAVTAVL